jgi:hypothetical protein
MEPNNEEKIFGAASRVAIYGSNFNESGRLYSWISVRLMSSWITRGVVRGAQDYGMSQTRAATSTQTARDLRWTRPRASLLRGLLLEWILLPRAALGAEFGGINIPAVAERERSAPATFADTARFTLSPDVRLTNSGLLERASLLAQTANTPSPAAANFNLTNSVPPWGYKRGSYPSAGDCRLRSLAESVRSRLLRLLRLRCRSLVHQTQLAPRLGRGRWQVHGQSAWTSLSRIDVPRVRASLRFELLARSGLYLRRKLVLRDSRRNHTSVKERPDQYRNRRQLPRRGAVPDVESLARIRERIPFLA